MSRRPARTSPLGRYAPDDDGDLVRVRLLGVPVRLWERSTEAHDELMRELSLLTYGVEGGAQRSDDLPTRLLELVAELRRRYGGTRGRDDATRQAALVSGAERVDLEYQVPRAVTEMAPALVALLDEVDGYCRSDAYLLTLACDDGVKAFRRWYVGEFVRQAEGRAPQPWDGPLE